MANVDAVVDRYLQLLEEFPPRSITSKEELLAAQAVIDRLIDTQDLTSELQDYLNVLGTLIWEYEEKHILMPSLSGVELLQALMAESGTSITDLLPIFGTEPIGVAILNGQQDLTVEHIQKLAQFFQVSPGAFLS
jgi:HTH-type transcriptional regulator/antitoxin HigA